MAASYANLNASIAELETAITSLEQHHTDKLQTLYELNRAMHDPVQNVQGALPGTTTPNKPAEDVRETLIKVNNIDYEIENIRTKMAEMKGYYSEILADLKGLQKGGSAPTDEINSWKETITFLIAVANAPDNTQAIHNLTFHAQAKLIELSNADSRLKEERAKFWRKVFMITGIALAIVGAIALTIGLAVLTGGASLALQLVAISCLTFGLPSAVGGRFISYMGTPENGQPMKKIERKMRDIAGTATASANGFLAASAALRPRDSGSSAENEQQQPSSLRPGKS